MNNKEKNHLLNTFKGIACIAVIFIHVQLPGLLGDISLVMAGFAVPFFFLISGYYSYQNTRKIIFEKLKHILYLLCTGFCLYLVIYIFRGAANGILPKYLSIIWNLENIKKAILLGDFNVVSAGHLWFLYALAWAYVFLIVIDNSKIYELLMKPYILIIIFCVKEFVLGYVICHGLDWKLASNALFCAIPYLLLGRFIASKKIKHFSNKFFVVAIPLSMLCCLIWIVLGTFDDQVVGTVLYSTFIFLFCINNPNKSIPVLEKIGERYSSYIYIIHIAIRFVSGSIAGYYSFGNNIVWRFLHPFIVCLFSTVCAMGIIRMKGWHNKKGIVK